MGTTDVLKLTASACAFILCAVTFAAEITTDAGWCTIVSPDACMPGQQFTVKVTLKGDIARGMKIGGDLYYATSSAVKGMASSGGMPKAAKSGSTLTFSYRMPPGIKSRGADAGVQPVFYLSKRGWNNAEKKANCPLVLPGEPSTAKKTSAPTASGSPDYGMKKMDYDWCVVESPATCPPGEEFNVIVTLKDNIPEGMKVGGDLHFASSTDYIGFAVWGGNPKEAKSGESLTFTYKMPENIKEKGIDAGVRPMFYLSEKGWDEAERKANAELTYAGDPSTDGLNTIITDWCVIVSPKTCAPGEKFSVKITLRKNIPAGLLLSSNLHLMKKGSNMPLKYIAWGGRPQTADPGGTYDFEYKMPDSATREEGCGPLFFISPDDWNQAVKRANSKPVLAP